jgi:FMN phosphatase YigB (HAD superfamily)
VSEIFASVAVDLDDVVLDFTGGVREAVRREFGVDPGEFTAWDLGPVLNPIVGRDWWDWLRDRSWIWSHFPAVDGAMGGLERLRNMGCRLECVTHKPRWAEHIVWRWLGKWRPPFHSVTIVPQGQSKAAHSGAEILVDDRPENCLEWAATGRPAILFERPHNAAAEFDEGVVFSAADWRTVVEVIEWVCARIIRRDVC